MNAVKDFLLAIPIPLWMKIMLASMIPFVEARYAILFFTDMGMPFWQLFMLSIIGNMIPVLIIIWVFRPILNWLKQTKYLHTLAEKLEQRTVKKAAQVQKYEALGLLIFVALPLPGTGAITGSMVAALLNMRIKYALPVILLGAVIATFITTGSLELVVNFIKML